jgi:hypothetical protein
LSFILRIIFTGLMAFVPNEDGTEITVLLLNADHGYHMSDGAALPHHNAIVLARGGACTGTCPTDTETLAKVLFPDLSTTAAVAALEDAVDGGGAWQLSSSELTVEKGGTSDPALPALDILDGVRGTTNGQPQVIPTTATQARDFTWIADFNQICSTCSFNTDLLATEPPSIVAARFRIPAGQIYTYSVARLGSDVTPVNFKRLDGTGSTSSYAQAIASVVAVDIEVSGSSIKIVDEKFDSSSSRTMTLSPDSNGLVELAVLNLPSFVPPASSNNDAPQVGKHFEMYYQLASTPPSAETRLVPRAGSSVSFPQVSWSSVHPSSAIYSDLLNKIRLDVGRGPYDRTICPPVRIDG